jgi:hypothetical protein
MAKKKQTQEVAYTPLSPVESIQAPVTKEKDLFDYILKYGTRVAKRVFSNNSGNVIYRVPAGRILFLLTASICADMTAGDYAKLYVTTGDQVFLEVSSEPGSTVLTSPVTQEISFSIPLRIGSDEIIVGESTTSEAIHCIVGYEINATDIYSN